MPGYGPAHLLAESTVVPACNALSPGIDRIYFWIYGSKMVVLVLPGPRDEPFWGIKAARAGGRRGCGQRLAEGELGPVRSTDPEAHPNSRAQPPCPRGPELSKLGTELGSGGIADDKLDSEKMPEAVLPPGCRRPVDLPPTARAVMRVCATRSGEYEQRTIKKRSALSSPSAQCPFLAAPARLPVLSRRCRCSLSG